MKTIYLDNNATTAVAPEVRDAILPYLNELYGNPSSMHTFGGQVADAVETAREQMASLLGANPDEIIFTSCGSESDNAAIWSAIQTQPEKRHLITTRVEHPAVLSVMQHWERQGYRVTYLGVDNKGRLDIDEYAAALTPDTALASIMFANNEVGNIYPIQRIAEMASAISILSSAWLKWLASAACCSIRMPCRPCAKRPLTLPICLRTCFRSPATSCTPPRVLACFMCARVCASARFCGAAIRSGDAARVRKMCRTLQGLAQRLSLPLRTCRKNASAWPCCATGLNRVCLNVSPTAWSTAMWITACPTPPILHLKTWRAKPSCSCSTGSASAQAPGLPAPLAALNLRTCCAPWVYPLLMPTAPSAFPSPATPRRKKWTLSSRTSLMSSKPCA